MASDNTPKVSVCFITYNHARYAHFALESVLSQRVPFGYEIVVGDDCSTDETLDILAQYHERYSDVIRVLPSERNLGVTGNFARTISACRGEYVAILEGDDVWTDPGKLALQVAELDSHPESVLSFHLVDTIDQDGKPVSLSYRPPRFRRVFHLEDLLSLGNFVPTCSVVFRNHTLGEFPAWFTDLWIADFSLHVLHARHGSLRLLRRHMGAYRVHPGGIFSQAARQRRSAEVLRAYEYLDAELGPRYHGIITSLRLWLRCVDALMAGELGRARRLAAQRLLRRPVNSQSLRAAITALSPRGYLAVARSLV